MIKVDIICGLLGVGKTTLIRQMLHTVYNNKKIIIVENEFGEINLDSGLFDKSNVSVEELSSGCVCCTLKLNFMELLAKISDTKDFDTIIIEPSGVADIRDILEVCARNPVLEINRIIMVVNANRIQRFLAAATPLFLDQIKHAKSVYLNFADFASEEKCQQAISYLKNINPLLSIVRTPLPQLSYDDFPNMPEDTYFGLHKSHADKLKKSSYVKLKPTALANSKIHSECITFSRPFTEQAINKLITFSKTSLNDDIYRIKAYLLLEDGRIGKFDYTAGDVFYHELDSFDVDKVNKFVIIGATESISKTIATLSSQFQTYIL